MAANGVYRRDGGIGAHRRRRAVVPPLQDPRQQLVVHRRQDRLSVDDGDLRVRSNADGPPLSVPWQLARRRTRCAPSRRGAPAARRRRGAQSDARAAAASRVAYTDTDGDALRRKANGKLDTRRDAQGSRPLSHRRHYSPQRPLGEAWDGARRERRIARTRSGGARALQSRQPNRCPSNQSPSPSRATAADVLAVAQVEMEIGAAACHPLAGGCATACSATTAVVVVTGRPSHATAATPIAAADPPLRSVHAA